MSGPSSDVPAERPLVSVVIPSFNQGAFVEEAVDSVLRQTYAPIEVIVVDAASGDDTTSRLQRFGDSIQVVRLSENRGPSATRNAGAREAAGEFVVFLDGDDRMAADCVEARVGLLASEPEADMVMGSLRIVDRQGALIREDPIVSPPRLETTFEQALSELSCPTCGLVVRKSAFEAIGGFDESLWIGEDTDLLFRITAQGRCLLDMHARADYRQVGGSVSRDHVLLYDSFRRMIDKNEVLGADRDAYRRTTSGALRDKVVNSVFGNILKDGEPRKFSRIARIVRRRPRLALFLLYWMKRAITNRAARAFGRGPLSQTQTNL